MNAEHESRRRLRIAKKHLAGAEAADGEARILLRADAARKAIESAAKGVLALWGPAPKTHDPRVTLLNLVDASGRLTAAEVSLVERLANVSAGHGVIEHVHLSYGDEQTGQTPDELFPEHRALKMLCDAREAVRLAEQLVEQKEPDG